jgi:hypothetical protein
MEERSHRYGQAPSPPESWQQEAQGAPRSPQAMIVAEVL